MNRNSLFYKIIHPINAKRLEIVRKSLQKKLFIWYETTDYPERIRSFKGIHQGERCFIIGNGPSLVPEDLDIIKDEISFSCNKIYYITDKTEWKPYYYLVNDRGFVRDDFDNIINKVKAKAKFVGIEFEKEFAKPYLDSDVIILREKTILEKMKPKWHLDIDDYICAGHTVTFTAFQMALYMGFKEIYFLGQDCSYFATYENGGVGQNHFYKSNQVLAQADADNMFFAFQSMKKLAEEQGIKVYNATRGGKLELFPRVKLEEIIGR
ncbi:MAG: DUF115 domain-containing protein [Abditibacteriota bacterium]|nr:DUF115 domain-containing protein [Abditibacteriota bacterium]